MKMGRLLLTSIFIISTSISSVLSSHRSARIMAEPLAFENSAEADVVLKAGYPGWKPTKFKRAPQPAQGRFLYYRKTPKVEKFRSAVHELYMRPYNYAKLDHHAVAVIQGDKVSGVVHFYQLNGPTSAVKIVGNLTGLTPGSHGFHVHQMGDTTNGCKSMGGHFNPNAVSHGAPYDVSRHVGDLGNIQANSYGVANFERTDRHISLNGIHSVLGRGVVVHAGQDDFGRGGNDGSLKTGNAGGRVACGVIGISNPSV